MEAYICMMTRQTQVLVSVGQILFRLTSYAVQFSTTHDYQSFQWNPKNAHPIYIDSYYIHHPNESIPRMVTHRYNHFASTDPNLSIVVLINK